MVSFSWNNESNIEKGESSQSSNIETGNAINSVCDEDSTNKNSCDCKGCVLSLFLCLSHFTPTKCKVLE